MNMRILRTLQLALLMAGGVLGVCSPLFLPVRAETPAPVPAREAVEEVVPAANPTLKQEDRSVRPDVNLRLDEAEQKLRVIRDRLNTLRQDAGVAARRGWQATEDKASTLKDNMQKRKTAAKDTANFTSKSGAEHTDRASHSGRVQPRVAQDKSTRRTSELDRLLEQLNDVLDRPLFKDAP
ncbi:MAG: hypothetical protein SFZ03_04950 [Candidatus Melainabacteria bacterium]|nr:hypothetical protein [Candidatus Melainabacteria bacterium]